MAHFEGCLVSGFRFAHRRVICINDCIYVAVIGFDEQLTSNLCAFFNRETKERTYQCVKHATIHVCYSNTHCRVVDGYCVFSKRKCVTGNNYNRLWSTSITEFDIDKELYDPDIVSGLCLLVRYNRYNWTECTFDEVSLIDRCPSITEKELRNYVLIAYCVFLKEILISNSNKQKTNEILAIYAEDLFDHCIDCIKDRIQPLNDNMNYLPSNKTAGSNFRTQLSRLLAISSPLLIEKVEVFISKHYNTVSFI